jgi:RsiW-degrading membrane proteinase PrsW (M82 family)
MELIALAIAPGLAICLFIYFKDKYNKEPFSVLLMSFILGMFAIVPVFFIEVYFGGKLTEQMESGIVQNAVSAFFVIAFTEEFFKFLVVKLYCTTRKSFDEPFDGIVYAVMVGMGFATLENIGYVTENGYGNGIMRMFLAVPGHATFAVLMGYFVSLAKFKPEKKTFYLFLSIFLPVFFHGLYDYFALYGGPWLNLGGAVGSLLIALRLSFIAIKRKQAYSKSYLEALAEVHKKQEEVI